jgi:hypothetical protein
MIADSPNSVAESASSTIDPDAQARRASDGELSAEFQSDLAIDEDAGDELRRRRRAARGVSRCSED